MVSARGFEPPAPGFLPLRFSPPCCEACSWSGLSLHHNCEKHSQGVARTVSTPSFQRTGTLGSGLARSRRSERSPNLSKSTMRFPLMAPNSNLRNPVLYPAELRGQTISLISRLCCLCNHACIIFEGERNHGCSASGEAGESELPHPRCAGKEKMAGFV